MVSSHWSGTSGRVNPLPKAWLAKSSWSDRRTHSNPMAETVKYLGIDVHVKTSVWCLLDEAGQIVKRGKVATTAPDLTALLKRLTEADDILAGQEAGKLSYFVHDVCTADGVKRWAFGPVLLEPVGFAMDRQMLLGVKRLAER